MASHCSPAADNVFGPAVGAGCRDGFDFTLLFEQSMLSILPASIILIASPFRIRYLLKRGIRTRYNPIRISKLVSSLQNICISLRKAKPYQQVVAASFAATQLALLILWIHSTEPRTKSSIPSAALTLIVAAQLLLLSWTEDTRSVRPSSLLSAYLLLSSLFDISQVRTLWNLQDKNKPIAIAFTASVGLKGIFLLLESIGKRRYLHGEYRGLPPESTSGILNRSFMWWINRLFLSGFKSILTLDDLNGLDKSLQSTSLSIKARFSWQLRKKPERRFEVPITLCKALWWPLVSAVFPRLCLIGFTFAQPFLISSLLDWISESHNSEKEGYGLLSATILIYLGLAISNLHYNHMLYRFISMFRGATSSLIYEHSLNIPDGSFEDRSVAITLMTTDIDRITACLVNLNECWARSIEVVVGMTLLSIRIGWVSIIPMVIVIRKSQCVFELQIRN